jgi:hypothetical protein
MDDRFFVGVIIGRIPDGRFEDMKVMVEKETALSRLIQVVSDEDLLQIDIFSVIDQVVALKAYTQDVIRRGDLSDQGFLGIAKLKVPIPVHPGKVTLHPDAEPELVPTRMIFLSHMGVVNVPEAIVLIEGDE